MVLKLDASSRQSRPFQNFECTNLLPPPEKLGPHKVEYIVNRMIKKWAKENRVKLD